VTDLERALADIAEVRERLGGAQRFRGYSALAAAASGVFALAAGVVQWALVPHPHGAHDGRVYFAIWFVCCAASVAVNYGAIAHWFVNDASARDRWQTATVGFSILPALVFGGILSAALLSRGDVGYLPGVWCASYGVGLLASRTTLPRGAVAWAALFMVVGFALLVSQPAIALSWWVLPLAFGTGQIAIAACVMREERPA
jgi:hypothetical protein